MTGAEAVLQTAAAAGVEVCFANPGTTEMALVHALDRAPQVRAVLGLFEGVCSGAADGFARMSGCPALTLLHLGAGLSNALANLHNARRARSPVVNLVGDQATWHREADAPLTSDIASLARPVSRWVRESRTSAGAAQDDAIGGAHQAEMYDRTDDQRRQDRERDVRRLEGRDGQQPLGRFAARLRQDEDGKAHGSSLPLDRCFSRRNLLRNKIFF